MQDVFKNHIYKNLSFLNESQFIIAISGGIDSVVLAHLCHSLKLKFSLAHCNFNLREEESNKDEEFVIQLAELLDVEVFIQNFDTEVYAKQYKRSIQMAARELRYQWFKELAAQLKFDYILTAHHADDNLETFLINFTRGTGLNGLTGIPMINGNVVRPLLPFSRAQIEAYATQKNIYWREDASNASTKYLRNKLRHEVVPILKSINPQLLESFQNTLTNLNDTAEIVNESLNAFEKKAIVKRDDSGITYNISEFENVNNPKAYLFECFSKYGFTEWNDIVDLLNAQSGKLVKSNTHRLIKHREHLILAELNSTPKMDVTLSAIDVQNGAVETPLGILFFNEADAITETSKNTIYIDQSKLKFPLELHIWIEGDNFQPIGMTGKKKVSKYLKDEKSSLIDKENTWVLKSDNKIIWLVGKRADERFKVTERTKTILRITVG
ncbi:tRNA lysidine(34) synthetase TilS [Winogradskyella bathintestinalis]|uniref:tRNA(Ile)-lysidine synthase n=1 Tax=Winogradskyella bathintestinalis TaxID=3035208 RepID=A0ABT7ZVR0_9FLAO|nr:tRNA lysidine(34) synthetase TilS [Winogradskyella bathintestinalis]MDN3493084.1 tRNA lysidine(34) synthetase TilS [Winogradskyella bathintestinalis]